MTDARRSREAAHFQRLYEADPDPWHFRTSPYEQAKYRRTLAALGERRFRSAFEVGCSIGVLTRLLAPRCDALLAVDLVAEPLAAARAACADQPWVRFQQMRVPSDWPNGRFKDGRFDLIVLSEVLYFLSPDDVAAVAAVTLGSLAYGGLTLLVNWLGRSGDPCTGDEAAQIFIDCVRPHLEPCTSERQNGYRLDLLGRRREKTYSGSVSSA